MSTASPASIDPRVWEATDMRAALAARNVSEVYGLLRRVGVSQRRIASLTGQSQSEVSEILKGRQVMAYDVLARIADGLGVPRGYMGLAYDQATAVSVVPADGGSDGRRPDGLDGLEEDETVKRRRFLAHAATVTFGAAVFGVDEGAWVPGPASTPTPQRIGTTDVRQVEAATRALRALDYQYGGGSCRDAVVAQLSWAQRMLSTSSATEQTTTRLQVALADLHNLAGWTSFDTGLIDPARYHFARALEFAKQGGDPSLVANVLYRTGRVYLHQAQFHQQSADDALKMFQLGQIAAQDSGAELTVALLCANEAWANAILGNVAQTKKLLGRAGDEFARGNLDEAPAWVRFFDETDLHAMIGTVNTVLSERDPSYGEAAVPELQRALAGYGSGMQRSRAFNEAALATVHLRQGDVDAGVQMGRQALDSAAGLKSRRALDRLEPLQLEAAKRKAHPDVGELAVQVARTRVA